MTAPALDEFLFRHAPAPPLAVAPALIRARGAINGALAELSGVRDDCLERGWPWRGDEADVRYGFFRQYEALEDTRATVRRELSAAARLEPAGRAPTAATTAARWELHGLLAGLENDDLDRDPGNGEWTLRQTLAHIVSGQRGYGWFTAWWLARRDRPADDYPLRIPEDVAAELPAEETEAVGSLVDIRRRLDETVDLSSGVFALLGEDELAARARWMGLPVDVRFRLNRWSSHLREHTVQLEKTLAVIGRETTEVQRLLRLVGAAYGRLEEELYMRHPSDAGPLDRALAAAEAAAANLAVDARSVRVAAALDAEPSSA